MAIKKDTFMIPGKSLAYIMMCCGGVLAFILLSILPTQRSLERMDREIELLKGQIKEQEILYPVYSNLIQQLQTEEVVSLPFPDENEYPKTGLNDITSIVSEMAQKNNLEVMAVAPDFKSIPQGSGMLLVKASFKGGLSDFRNFLIQLNEMPSVRTLEEIQIKAIPDSKELNLAFWLALST